MVSKRTERRLETLLTDHKLAVREYLDRASAVSPSRWLVERAEGKWTPAQETRHVILSYEALRRELNGEGKIRVRGTPLKRWIWRLVGLPQILWRKRIPIAVNAPREIRPEWEVAAASELLPALERLTLEFDNSFAQVWRTDPRRTLTHYFFGALTLDQAIRMLSVHTRHHAAFLPEPNSTGPAT